MANKVAELYADFRVNFQKATLDVVNTTLGQMRVATIAEIATVAGLTRALYNLGAGAVATASEYHLLGEVYGLNAGNLQRMEVAGLAANVGVDKMRASVIGLQQNLAGLNLGQINSGFLEAAGFLGLSVRPGTTEEDVMGQLFKKVPQFVKAHGAMGKAMASTLISQMGIAPEMLQYILAGKQFGKGPVMKDPQIEALTKVSEGLAELSRDIQFLAYDAIGPLVEAILPITNYYLSKTPTVGQELKAVGYKDLVTGFFNEHANYRTPAQQKQASDFLLKLHNAKPLEGFGDFVAKTMISKNPEAPAVAHKSETHIAVYGVEDHKIAGAVKRAADASNEKQRRDHAMHTALNNPVGQ